MKPADIKKLGKYEIIGELGKGAMGVVYKGFDPGIERYVAIKTVRKDLISEDDGAQQQVERFKREAVSAGRVMHPNIVGIYEYGEDGNTAFIAMEFIEGKSLKDYFDEQQRFGIPAIGRIMIEMLAGLEYAHKNGIVHRDIKPANIMMNKAGEVKITDFGIARIESSNLTQAGTVLGTPSYMSPEQFMGQTVDARSDLFSAGGVLYQLLTGEKPFTGSLTTIMHKVLHSQPEPPSHLNVQVPPAFDPVVQKAMSKRPADRFQNAAEFSAAVKAAVENRPMAAPAGSAAADESESTMTDRTVMDADLRSRAAPAGGSATAAPAPASAPAAPRRKSALPLIAAAVGGLLAVGGGAAFYLSQTAPPAPPLVNEADVVRRQQNDVARMQREAAERDRQAREAAAERDRQARDAALERERLAEEAARRAEDEARARQDQVAALETTLAHLREAVARFDCAVLAADLTTDGGFRVTGVAGDDQIQGQVQKAVADLAPEAGVTVEVATVTKSFCAPLKATQALRQTAGTNHGLSLKTTGPDAVFRSGEDLIIEVKGPDFPSYLQVDYFMLDGSVMHLLPNGLEQDGRLASRGSRRLGERSTNTRFWTIGPPYGRELIIAIASPLPLFQNKRPEAEENGAAYLADLARALQAVTRASSRPPVAAAMFIKTTPN